MTKIDQHQTNSKVVEQENGCFVGWFNKTKPRDDIIIRVERALDVDGEGQMIASVLSKKIAAGSTHVVIDIPIGKTAKVRTEQDAEKLKYYFNVVGKAVGIKVNVLFTDGSQPIGRGLVHTGSYGCVVFCETKWRPQDLRNKALLLAASIIDMVHGTKKNGLTACKGNSFIRRSI
jgi:thymidine phosphorylase